MDNNIDNTNQTTFWEFIEKHNIEIPVIQRDYAQGRNGKEELRESFLNDIKNALHNPPSPLILDFVYGIEENDKLNPLDGQQRLTTLYLLHWYLASRLKNFEEYSDIFKKFTYETRVSSREFCEELSNFKQPKEVETLSDLIINQTWFFSFWKQDPTIQAMLNMLDDIHEKFKDSSNDYWYRLIGKLSPLIFYYIDLEQLKLSDDLYIKMNARGKQLTSFENFKADLVSYIEQGQIESKDISPNEKISYKLDTTWTDVFWRNNKNGKIDDIYIAFLNRYFLNLLITKKDEDKYCYSEDDFSKNTLDTFVFLYGDTSNDSKIKYSKFSLYEKVLTTDCFENLNTIFNHFHEIDKKYCFQPNWNKQSSFRFIPEFVEKDNSITITTLTQIHRVVFWGVCKYLELNKFDDAKFNDWMRIVWNLVENSGVTTISSMIGVIRLINELSNHSINIIEFLSSDDVEINSTSAKKQIAEERKKAKLILIQRNGGDKWEDFIVESERFPLFTGDIRCLFTNSEIDYQENIEKCKLRWTNAEKYFSNKEVAEEYCDNRILLRSLIVEFTNWKQFWGIAYDNEWKSWQKIVKKDNLLSPIRKILLGINDIDLSKDSLLGESKQKQAHKELYQTTILENVATNTEMQYRRDWNNSHALYPPYCRDEGSFFIIVHERNQILFSCPEIKTEQQCADIPFYKGRKIYFSYHSRNFLWGTNGQIFLLDEHKKHIDYDNAYFLDRDIENNDILSHLNCLIERYPAQ